MNNNRNLEMTAETLRSYHRKALTFFRENLNPVLAQHFIKTRDNSALLVIDPSAPPYIKNIQSILNLVLLTERAIAAYSDDHDSPINFLFFTLPEYYDLVNETLAALRQFDLKASPETQNLIAVLRNHDRISFESLTNTLPELSKLTKEITGSSSSAIEKLGDVVSDINAALDKSKEAEPSNRQVFEDALAVSAPNLVGDKLALKDSEERYVLNPQTDGEVLTSVKRIANSLDYLNAALNFKLNAEKGQFFGGLVEGFVKYEEVICAIYSLSPAILNTSEKMRNEIHGKARKLIPVIREAILSAIKMENESGLRPGYLLDQIMPYAKRYMDFAKKIGMKLSEDEKNLFLSERQALRKKTSDDASVELNKTIQLKETIDRIETLLYTSTPLSNFDQADLGMLMRSVPLLQLPKELETQFKAEINAAFEGVSIFSVGYGYLVNLAGHRISTQNQVWDHVRKQFSDIDAHETMLESTIASINLGRVDELITHKSIVELNLEEAEFLNSHLTIYINAYNLQNLNFGQTFDDIQKRIASLKQPAQQAVVKNAPEISTPTFSAEDLTVHSKNINSRNIKMAVVAKEFRQYILGNIKAYFSESMVENFNLANNNDMFEVFSDDPKHIQDMKNFLSALTVLERTFRASESSYFSGLMQASLLKDIASRFHLNYSQQMELVKVFFGSISTQAKSLGGELTTDLQSGLYLKEEADSAKPSTANTEKNMQGLIGFINETLSFSEWAYSYIDFKPSQGSANVDLKPYVEQMQYIKQLTEQFIKDYFKDDFAKLFTPNSQGLYDKNENDTAIVKDAKTLLNALHHMAVATDDVNNYLQRSYFDLPTAVSSISTFVTSLNELDLTSTHAQLCGLKAQLIDAANTYVNQKINPLLRELMKQGDRYEQAIGLRQGVLTNHIQSVVDLYQAQQENVSVPLSLSDDNAFLEARHEERNKMLEAGEAELERLQVEKTKIGNQVSKQLPILEKWYNVLNGKNKSLSSLDLLQSVKCQIALLGDQKTIDEFSPIVETLIQNYNNLEAGNSREVKLFDMLRDQIEIRYNYLQKKLAIAKKAIDDFNATTGYQIDVIRDHQKTLIDNAQKAEEAVILSAEAREKAEEAQAVIDQIKLEDAEQPTENTVALKANAKRLTIEADKLAEEAKKLADGSHMGVAKREVAETKAEVREVTRNLNRLTAPTVEPEENENQHGFFMQILISTLKFIADLLDSFVFVFKTMFSFPDNSSSTHKQNKRKSSVQNEESVPPSSITHAGDDSVLEDTESSEETDEERLSKRPKSDDRNSYSAARTVVGFHAPKSGTAEESQHSDVDHSHDIKP